MNANDLHFEPYIQLGGLTAESVLIAWGGFYFGRHSNRWRLLDAQEVNSSLHRRQTIGSRSEPYGEAVVEVLDRDGCVVAAARTSNSNYALVEGLRPDTEYRYRLTVNGRQFAQDGNHDWLFTRDSADGDLLPSGRGYDLRFRTHPARDSYTSVTLAAMGDYGVGIHRQDAAGRAQRLLAAALETEVRQSSIRLIVTTGDNIYFDPLRAGTGAQDDDWFFGFYQPYRYLLAQIPVYPVVGNHDTDDTEASDDLNQIFDNFYLRQRHQAGELCIARTEQSLTYTFRFGATLQFLCVDTTRDERSSKRFVELEPEFAFCARTLTTPQPAPYWQIVVSHHPPLCAGPYYGNDDALRRVVAPLLELRPGRLMLSGHEHNFQHSRCNGVDYLITGAGGQLRPTPPTNFRSAHTRVWAAEPHFLKLDVTPQALVATPMGAGKGAQPTPVRLRQTDGERTNLPVIIGRKSRAGAVAVAVEEP